MSTDIPSDIAIKASALKQKRKGHHIFRIHAKKKLYENDRKTALFFGPHCHIPHLSLCVLFRLTRFAPVQTSSWVPLNPTHCATTCHCHCWLAGCSQNDKMNHTQTFLTQTWSSQFPLATPPCPQLHLLSISDTAAWGTLIFKMRSSATGRFK